MYLVDANILIDAKNRFYAFDIAPGFWAWLDQVHRNEQVMSIDAVRDELLAGDDELADWARARRDFFLPADQLTVQNFAPLSTWAASQYYKPAALREFTSDQADFVLIAHAAGHGDIVVTHEQPSPDSRKKIKIPDACAAVGVETADIFTVLRRTGAILQLRGEGEGERPEDQVAPTIPGLDRSPAPLPPSIGN